MNHSKKTFRLAALHNRQALTLSLKRCEVLKGLVKSAYYEGAADKGDFWENSMAKKELGG
jgi:hypothetical protein